MYIINSEAIENKKGFGKLVAKYIMEKNIPLLSKKGDIYYFAETELLAEVLENAPAWIKLLILIGA